jgi:WD40 repeat protein
MAWLLFCDSTVRFWDTRTHNQLDAVFPHTLATECAGPIPAISPDGRIMATQTSDSLRLWDLQTLTAISPKLEHEWGWDMEFSSDGKWLFIRGRRELKILNSKTGKLVAGPFRHDLIDGRFVYSASNQQLATFENNDGKEGDWKSVAVIRSGKKTWTGVRRVELAGHTREANWIDNKHLLVVADQRRPGQKPPFSYGRKLVYSVSLAMDKPEVRTLKRHGWISSAVVAPDGKHVITTTGEGTDCWKPGEEKPVWTKHVKYRVTFSDQPWVLLHGERSAIVCSLASGQELWRKDDVLTSRLQGSHVWLCRKTGIEVWRADKQAGGSSDPKPIN